MPVFKNNLSGDELRILLMVKECMRSAEKETEIYGTRTMNCTWWYHFKIRCQACTNRLTNKGSSQIRKFAPEK
jgi:hypothetical protein